MNNLTRIFLFALVSGCSVAPVSSLNSLSKTKAVVPNWGVDTKVKFFADKRPVDGNLDEVIFDLSEGRYTATQHISHGGLRPDPQPQDTYTQLASKLTCENHFADEIGTLTSVACRFDARPVDGALVEIFAQLKDSGYEVNLIVTPSGFGGNTDPVITLLGSEMRLEIVTQSLPRKITCIDTATFADGPGTKSVIAINKKNNTAKVTRTPVRLRGQDQEPSVLDKNLYSVESRTAANGALVLSIVEKVDTTIDWSTAGACYKFFAKNSFYIEKKEDGTFAGRSQLLGLTFTDPSVPDCSYPRMRPPQPIEIACTASK